MKFIIYLHFSFMLFVPYFLKSDGQSSNMLEEYCPEQSCGDIIVKYPFYRTDTSPSAWSCGYHGFGVTCPGDPVFYLNSNAFEIENISYQNKSLTLVDPFVMDNSTCPRLRQNFTIGHGLPLEYSSQNLNLTVYFNCTSSIVGGRVVDCLSMGGNRSYIIEGVEPEIADWYVFCEEKVLTALIGRDKIDGWFNSVKFGRIMKQGFELEWTTSTNCHRCEESNGRCGFNDLREFLCFCNDGTISSNDCRKGNTTTITLAAIAPIAVFTETAYSSITITPTANGPTAVDTETANSAPIITRIFITPTAVATTKRIALIVGPIGTLTIVILIAILYFQVCNSVVGRPARLPDRKQNKVGAFMKQFESSGPKRYSYPEIREMTNSFADKLGQGGFGSVYKGKLRDGRVVAVKVLNRTEDNGDDFINEVASISKTSHVNVITLLGFCYDKKRRALIFEFMPNGSLDRYLSSDTQCRLDWTTLFKISIGSARGLEYLHRGCNTRIVHFDIKPHNILLDETFCPKISDFGLAKLTMAKESILSMCSARGTVSYIAPEVFFRQFGVVSNKSDVYSYGMMVLEMVGVRTNSGVQADRSSQNYFPQWIYDHLEFGSGLNIQVVQDDEEEEISKKLILVGLWCIQTNPSDRPSMGKVVEMLEGRLQALQIPPKPYLQSPPKPTQQSSPMSMQQSSTSFT